MELTMLIWAPEVRFCSDTGCGQRQERGEVESDLGMTVRLLKSKIDSFQCFLILYRKIEALKF